MPLLRAMLFVDGTWLYANTQKMRYESGGRDLQLDYGRLPECIRLASEEQLSAGGLDLVRTYFFGSVADNFDPLDTGVVERRREFFDMLREAFHYEVEVFPVNFRGKRVRREDRHPEDSFEPKEKCVDIAMATSIVYHAAVPHLYDVAIVILGDRDYAPALRYARKLGKRVLLASIRGCCSRVYLDQTSAAGLRDGDVIWINDLVQQLELRHEAQLMRCESPDHEGEDREFYTTFRPRKGQLVFCDACRARKQEEIATLQTSLSAALEEESITPPPGDPRRVGVVTAVKYDNGYGFLVDDEGKSYFFHVTGLTDVDFDRLTVGTRLLFNPKHPPSGGRAGAADRLGPAPE